MQTLVPMGGVGGASMIKGFTDAKDYIGKRFEAEVSVELEKDSKSERAQRALPGKPAIDIIWG
jgi:hypothetical protein